MGSRLETIPIISFPSRGWGVDDSTWSDNSKENDSEEIEVMSDESEEIEEMNNSFCPSTLQTDQSDLPLWQPQTNAR